MCCPNWTPYSTWDPTTADQNSCMREHADYAAVHTSLYIIWLFCITIIQLVHFYSLFVKSSSEDVLPQWLSMLDPYSQRLSLSSYKNMLIFHLLQYWPNARPLGTSRNTRSVWLHLVQISKGWDETKTLEKAAETWAVVLLPGNIWSLYQLWKYLKFYLGSQPQIPENHSASIYFSHASWPKLMFPEHSNSSTSLNPSAQQPILFLTLPIDWIMAVMPLSHSMSATIILFLLLGCVIIKCNVIYIFQQFTL